MKTSIRKFLLINLLLAITVTTSLTVLGNYYLDQQDIQDHVSTHMGSSATSSSITQNNRFHDHAESSHELGWRIVIDDLYIMLITFPLSGLLIWIIIGRGLDSLDRITIEVANREPGHLDPVYFQTVPEEIKPLIDELNHLFSRLKEGFEREQRFAADAAHELRTPLAAIKAQAQVALNTPNVDEKNAALDKLLISVNRCVHIVQQLLIMSKLTPNPNNANQFDDVQLSRITRDVLAMLAPSALDKNIELEFQQSSPTIPLIKGNATALGILIRNLVDNAIRYNPENSLVLVRIDTEEGHVRLSVCDQGPGIPKELYARVFERFFRILGNKSTGSGLGLSIVQEICNMHHASIKLQPQPSGTGLIVTICF